MGLCRDYWHEFSPTEVIVLANMLWWVLQGRAQPPNSLYWFDLSGPEEKNDSQPPPHIMNFKTRSLEEN
jgi:hypothetical protein